jgi:AmmeMemoRadiSam system protein A
VIIMTAISPILAAFLAPHPPVIIPEVGQRSHEADLTVAALRQAALDLQALEPETIVVISPHAPMFSDYVFFYGGSRLAGTFESIGHPDVSQAWPADTELADAIITELGQAGISGGYLSAAERKRHGLGNSLDHGVLVPMYFLAEHVPSVRLVALASSDLDSADIFALGQAITTASRHLNRRIVLVASGDLSHKVNQQSPYGSCPEGAEFDHQIIAAIQSGNLQQILEIDQSLRDGAAECGYRSLIALCGAFSGIEVRTQVYHYEAPFGIGYGVARFIPVRPAPEAGRTAGKDRVAGHSVPVQIAWRTLEKFLTNHKRLDRTGLDDLDLAPFDQQRAGVFVSLKKAGNLRGCIGTTGPTTANTVAEIIQNAISAATQDPRFDPVRATELPGLSISVDILGEAEPVADRVQLDPKKYGVIVRRMGRTGLLLPDLEGVDTVEEQLAIACHKAEIDPSQPYSIERFQVVRYY